MKQLSGLTGTYGRQIAYTDVQHSRILIIISQIDLYRSCSPGTIFVKSRTCQQIPRYRAYKSLDYVALPRTRSGRVPFSICIERFFTGPRTRHGARCATLPEECRYLSTALMDIFISRAGGRKKEKRKEKEERTKKIRITIKKKKK